MIFPVLERVDRRRRRRRRGRGRLAALLLLAVAAGAAGAFLGHHRSRRADHPAALVARVARTKPARPQAPLLLVAAPPLLRRRFDPPLTARSAILVDAKSGRVLWALRSRRRRAIASTTKIMTAVVALHRVRWRSIVTIRRSVPRVPLVKEGLRAGEHVPAWKLFYGMLLYSGNDDALALAESSAGSRRAFVALMNTQARELGLGDSRFSSPSGVIDAGNYSTARDLAALTRYALRNSRFRSVVRTPRERVPWPPPTFAKVYLNKNLLLTSYRGADGVKTGWTTEAGHCLVASASRGGVSLIAVVLHSADEFRDARRLLDLGFRRAARP